MEKTASRVSSVPSHGRLLGLVILFLVDVLWVSAGEITRYIFLDLKFKRPFFLTYVKLCMLIAYLIPYIFSCGLLQVRKKGFTKIVDSGDDDHIFVESLTPSEFERVVTSEGSDVDYTPKIARQVRFSEVREVRHMPLSLADEALRARLPYSGTQFCYFSMSNQSKNIFFLSLMWIICTLTYQASLIFISVSSLNLLSSSSSLFVLVLSAIFPFSSLDYFTWIKLLLVICNFAGVALVSEYSVSSYGIILALLSAFCYAIYLVFFSYLQRNRARLDLKLIMGTVGVLTIVLYTPLLFVLHYFSIEPLQPLPDYRQSFMLVLNGVVGTLFTDFLWLQATLLTSSLAASVSLSMCIPLSFGADYIFRSQVPSLMKLVAAFPITISFLGAVLLRSYPGLETKKSADRNVDSSEEGISLINESDGDEEEQL